MRIFINAGLLLMVGAAMLAACGDDKASSNGGTGGWSTAVSTGGTPTFGSGGAAGSSTKQGSGGAGGTMAIATGGAPTGGAGGVPMGGAGGSTTGSVEVEGASCSVEGQRSDCATAGPNPCLQCRGAWLSCYQGKWYRVHCDPIPEPPVEPRPDAAIDTNDAADVPQAPDGAPLDTAAIDTGPVDSGNAIDGDGRLRGYLVFANEVMAFEACGTTNLAWANLQGWEEGKELVPDRGPFCMTTDAGPAPCPGSIYVELMGTLVSGGNYGHMSKYSSQLTVSRYLAASKTGPADCPFLAPVFPN